MRDCFKKWTKTQWRLLLWGSIPGVVAALIWVLGLFLSLLAETWRFQYWMGGLAVSLFGGHAVTWLLVNVLRCCLNEPLDPEEKEPAAREAAGPVVAPAGATKPVPPWITGTVERLFFTFLVGFDIPGVAPTMMGWIGVKIAVTWMDEDRKKHGGTRAYTGLLGSVASLFLAFIGGLIFRVGLQCPPG